MCVCVCVRVLCASTDDLEQPIAAAGGVKLVAAVLRRHADHAGVAEAACGALANLSVNGA